MSFPFLIFVVVVILPFKETADSRARRIFEILDVNNDGIKEKYLEIFSNIIMLIIVRNKLTTSKSLVYVIGTTVFICRSK